VSIFQNVDWVALAMVVCLLVIFAVVNVRLRLSLLRKEAKQLSQDVQRLTMLAEERRLSQLNPANNKDEQTQVTA
jgi:signal transduction histidine kinase